MTIRLFFLLFFLNTFLFSNSVELTQKEKEFLKKHPTITLGSDSTWSPYIILNNDGSITGYDADILKLINQNTGANFKLTTGKWKNILKDAKSKILDGLSTSAVHKEREKYFNFSDIYVSTQRILITSHINSKNIKSVSDLKGKRIAYQKSNLFEEKIVKRYKDTIGIPYDSYGEIINALINGEVDASIGSYALIYYSFKENLPYIKTVAKIPDSTLNLVFSLRNDYPEAISILNKGLNSISFDEKLKLHNKWFFKSNNSNSNEFLTDEEKLYLKEHPILKVQGISNFPPFNFYMNGKSIGYAIDYLNLMANYIDVEFEFVNNKTFPETLKMFKKGEIDILPHIARNKEREKFISYTNFDYIEYSLGATLRKDSNITSLDDLKDKTIATVDKTFIHTFFKNKYPNQKLLLVNSTNNGVLAVSNEKADAFIGSIPSMNFYIKKNWLMNLKSIQISDIGLPKKLSLPMGVQKDNLILKSILEKVNEKIEYSDVLKLQEKWLNVSNKKDLNIHLNKQEKEYLSKKDEIKICVLPNWLPFEQIDKNLEHKGIGHDILEIISSKIDKEFVLVPTKEWSQSLQNIRDRKCDVLPVAMDVPSRKNSMNFTKPYVDEPFVIATTSDKFFIKDENDLSNKKVGVVKSYAFIDVLKRKNPLIEIVEVKDTKEGLEKVKSGELFGYIDTMPTIGYFIQKLALFDLKIAGKLPYDIKLSIASRNDEPHLNTILQKALNTISKDEIRKIVGKWIEIKVHQEFDYTKLIYIIVAFSILVLLISYKNKKITEQKNEFRQLIENSSDGVFVMNLKGDLVECSDKACKMLGYTKEEMLKLNVSDWEYKYSKEDLREIFNNYTKDTVINHTKHKRKDGTIYDTEIYAKKITLSNKELIYASVRDITEEKRLKDKIIEQKEELESIFNYSKDGIAVIDLDSKFLKVNDAYLDMLNLTKEEITTKTSIELTVDEDKAKSKEALNTALENSYYENLEKTYIINKDRRVSVNISLSLLPDKKSFILLARDTTKSKLIESQSRLASMGQMIGNIAHQWRQPLSVITTSASGIHLKSEFGKLDQEYLYDSLDTIVNQAKYLSNTIDNFRNFIQSEQSLEQTTLKEVTDNTLSLIGASLKNNYIQLILDIDEDSEILGSKNELTEAFLNILNNAKDALKDNIENEEDRLIFISTKKLKDTIELTIKDTAGGIDKNIIDKIFEPYFTTKHQSQGTGLGLAIVDKILRERHKCLLDVYNDTFIYEGKEYTGTCFSIVFDLETT